jgi:hypothetical protein
MRCIDKNFNGTLLILALATCVGCGSSGPETAEVEGIVRLDD